MLIAPLFQDVELRLKNNNNNNNFKKYFPSSHREVGFKLKWEAPNPWGLSLGQVPSTNWGGATKLGSGYNTPRFQRSFNSEFTGVIGFG